MDLQLIALIATSTVTAAVVLLNVIAPLTDTDKDDKILAALRWLEELLARVVVPKKLK